MPKKARQRLPPDEDNGLKRGEVDLRREARILHDMETVRGKQMPMWEAISRYIAPGRGIFDKQEPNTGERKDRYLLDPTPLQALHVLSAGLQGGLTSPSRPWFRLGVRDAGLADYGPARLWLDETEKRMQFVMEQSNVYNALHMLYQEVGAFGIGAMLLEEDARDGIRAYTMTAGEYCVSFDEVGMPDRFARSFWMTAQQLVDMFGADAVSDAVRGAVRGGRVGQWFRVHHMITDDRYGASGRPYMSVYWLENYMDRPLRVGGYEEFPVFVPRWEVVGSDFYGRGPGWDAYGESRTLQELRSDYLNAQKIMIAPPMVGPSSLRRSHRDLRPNGVTYVDGADPNQAFRPLYQIQPDLQGQITAMMDSREMIRQTFFADLFLAILRSEDKQMTATQVNAITNEQMMMIGPVYERLNHELLDPFVGRTFGIMDRLGLIPPIPEELGGMSLQIEYISMLAQAQQMVGLSGIDRLTEYALTMGQAMPDVMDKLDMDEAVDQYAKMLGVPAAIVRSDDAVDELRQQRQQQMQQQQELSAAQQATAAANQGASAMKMAGEAAAGGGLDSLMAQLGLSDEQAVIGGGVGVPAVNGRMGDAV